VGASGQGSAWTIQETHNTVSVAHDVIGFLRDHDQVLDPERLLQPPEQISPGQAEVLSRRTNCEMSVGGDAQRTFTLVRKNCLWGDDPVRHFACQKKVDDLLVGFPRPGRFALVLLANGG
jgi:hypothetical protein